MQATRLQLFYAQGWPIRIWVGLLMLMSGSAGLLLTEPTRETLADRSALLLFLGTMGICLALGYFTALLFGWMILGPLYQARALKNGAPFEVGDQVQILAGRHRGRVTTVYSLWQKNTVRVKLGEKEARKFQDVFDPSALLKVPPAETKGNSATPARTPPIAPAP